MNNNSPRERSLNALSYISVLFLPIIFPFIIWLMAKFNQTFPPSIKKNALIAMLTQLITVSYPVCILLNINNHNLTGMMGNLLTTFGTLIFILLWIFNVAMGIKFIIGRY